MLPTSPPDADSVPHPGTTVADLRHFLQKNMYIATMTTPVLQAAGVDAAHMMSMMTAHVLADQPVIKRGSAQDILEGTLVLAVLDNLEVRLQSPHKGASSSSSNSSSRAPQPLDNLQECCNLAINALSYVSTITAALVRAHCAAPEDTAPLLQEPFNGIRKALLPRLRQFLFCPHPTVVSAAVKSAGALTGIVQLPAFAEIENLIIHERHPTRWVLARALDSAVSAFTPQQLASLQEAVQIALVILKDAPGPDAEQTYDFKPISVDFDFPASSYAEVAVCDACGRHNCFPLLMRWAWREPCALLSCSGCRQRRYCSTACQKAAWTGHKQRCKAAQAARKAEKEH